MRRLKHSLARPSQPLEAVRLHQPQVQSTNGQSDPARPASALLRCRQQGLSSFILGQRPNKGVAGYARFAFVSADLHNHLSSDALDFVRSSETSSATAEVTTSPVATIREAFLFSVPSVAESLKALD